MLSKVSRATVSIMGVGALAALANINFSPAFAVNPAPADINFQANVKEALSVSITVPDDWVSGDIDTLLRNKITLNVNSNNVNGFTASMTTDDENTYLAHTTIEPTDDSLKINTLQSNWTRSDTFTTNFWGYSIDDDNETEPDMDLDYRNDLNKFTNKIKGSKIFQDVKEKLVSEDDYGDEFIDDETYIRNVNEYDEYDEYEPIINETHIDYDASYDEYHNISYEERLRKVKERI